MLSWKVPRSLHLKNLNINALYSPLPDVNFWDLRGAFNPDTDVLVKKKKKKKRKEGDKRGGDTDTKRGYGKTEVTVG